MTTVKLKGVFKSSAKGHTYHYAWRGGPRLCGEPGSPEFVHSYYEAHQRLRQPNERRFRSLVTHYKASSDYERLATSTKRQWEPWLARIADYFGDLRIGQFDRPEKIRPVIRKWRNTYADTPRTADMGMQVLSRVLSYGVDPLGKLAANPCEGVKYLYSCDRSEIIWTDSHLAQIKAVCSAEIAHVVDLASHTGLRLSDLLRLSWSHVGKEAIVLPTGKSRGRREAIIPLYNALRGVLRGIPKRSPIVLTNSRSAPWTKNGFGSSFNKAKVAAKMEDHDLHFHDLRGTAATRFHIAGLSDRVIAEIMGWEEEHVRRIMRRYVGRSAATRAAIRQLNKAEKGTKSAKLPAKPSGSPHSQLALSD
jgi:integrase